MLTKEQKNSILHLSESGQDFAQIAEQLNIPANTVKSIYYRFRKTPNENACKYCGKSIKQKPGRKKQIYCSHECSVRWWNDHIKAQPFKIKCANCGKEFISFGNPNKLFCSRKCYCEHEKQEKNHE